MSVVSGGKIIFCEGKKTSLDSALLNRLLDGLPGKPTVVGAGGKFNFTAFADGYFGDTEQRNQHWLAFRDRDFDTEPTPEVRLVFKHNKSGKNKILLSHRACVENYLLDSELIHKYWSDKFQEKQEFQSKWAYKDSPGIEALQAWIRNSAEELWEYQAICWALAEVANMSGAREQIRTTWTDGSGKLPDSLKLEDCEPCALDLIKQFRKATDNINETTFRQALNKYTQKFDPANRAFWDNRDYLIWFHGKDIQKVMARQRMPTCKNPISLGDYFEQAIKYIDFNRHPDLIELREKIQAL